MVLCVIREVYDNLDAGRTDGSIENALWSSYLISFLLQLFLQSEFWPMNCKCK